ncbi:MAG: sulfurtransferase TusA family protein [Acetobacter sp.]|nr:sulfurtransferase TusA family protein [Acetobacter sp.]
MELLSMENDKVLDVTKKHCPMTFVYVRLALEQMQVGQKLVIHLAGEEPYRNVKRSIQLLGHHLIAETRCSDNADCSNDKIVLEVLKKE